MPAYHTPILLSSVLPEVFSSNTEMLMEVALQLPCIGILSMIFIESFGPSLSL